MSTTATQPDPPKASDVRTSGGGMTVWRPQNGRMVTGREESLRDNPDGKLVGYLRRIGTHHGQNENGETYSYLEADLHTSEGMQNFHTSLKSLVSSTTFGEGLLAAAKDELISVYVVGGKTKNRYGNITSYVNIDRLDPVTFAPRRCKEERMNKDKPLDDTLDDILRDLQSHPAYADRAPKDEVPAQATPWTELGAAIEKAGKWPTLTRCAAGYLRLAEKINQRPSGFYGQFSDVPASTWAKLLAQHEANIANPATAIPKTLAEELAKGSVVNEDEYDPFADE